MPFDFDWVDAFTDTLFGGNGCAVVHGGAVLPAETCIAYTRETSLVECTFTGPSTVADFKVRYFLPTREIPFAGHPTIATVAALIHRGEIGDGTVTLETGAGIVSVDVQDDLITMTQVAPSFGQVVDKTLVAAVGSIDANDIIAPPQITSTGLPFCITVLKDRSAVQRLRFDVDALGRLAKHLGSGIDLMEPFWCCLEGATDDGDTFARLLLAPPSPAEDPFTGSATGAMAAYLWANQLIDKPVFTAQQGHDLGRPGEATVEVLGPPDAITGVRVGGRGKVVMSGTAYLD